MPIEAYRPHWPSSTRILPPASDAPNHHHLCHQAAHQAHAIWLSSLTSMQHTLIETGLRKKWSATPHYFISSTPGQRHSIMLHRRRFRPASNSSTTIRLIDSTTLIMPTASIILTALTHDIWYQWRHGLYVISTDEGLVRLRSIATLLRNKTSLKSANWCRRKCNR
jgi:hypothetical protein